MTFLLRVFVDLERQFSKSRHNLLVWYAEDGVAEIGMQYLKRTLKILLLLIAIYLHLFRAST